MDDPDRDLDRAFTELLAQRLPQHPAPLALKRRLAAQWPDAHATRVRGWRRHRAWLAAAAAAVVVIVAGGGYERMIAAPERARTSLLTEAVNDHVRLVQSTAPLGIVSAGIHDVKPWFTGKLDFAPDVKFEGDEEFPLRGGSVGYFVDRAAAVFVYARRKHTVSLLVFRADGLALPDRAAERALRGFNTRLWREGALGYALVSDVDRADLGALASKLGAPR